MFGARTSWNWILCGNKPSPTEEWKCRDVVVSQFNSDFVQHLVVVWNVLDVLWRLEVYRRGCNTISKLTRGHISTIMTSTAQHMAHRTHSLSRRVRSGAAIAAPKSDVVGTGSSSPYLELGGEDRSFFPRREEPRRRGPPPRTTTEADEVFGGAPGAPVVRKPRRPPPLIASELAVREPLPSQSLTIPSSPGALLPGGTRTGSVRVDQDVSYPRLSRFLLPKRRQSQRTQLALVQDALVEGNKSSALIFGEEEEPPMPKLENALKEEYKILKSEKKRVMIEQAKRSKLLKRETKGSLVFHDFKWQDISGGGGGPGVPACGDGDAAVGVEVSRSVSSGIMRREQFPLGRLGRKSPRELVSLINSPLAQRFRGHSALWSDVERQVLRIGGSLGVVDLADVAFAVGRADRARGSFVARLGQWVAKAASAAARGKRVLVQSSSGENRAVVPAPAGFSLRLPELAKLLYAIAKAPDFRDPGLVAKLCVLCTDMEDLETAVHGPMGATFFRDVSLITDALGRLEGSGAIGEDISAPPHGTRATGGLSRYLDVLRRAAEIEEMEQEVFSLGRWCAQVAHVMRREWEQGSPPSVDGGDAPEQVSNMTKGCVEKEPTRTRKNMFMFPVSSSDGNMSDGGCLEERHVARVLRGFGSIFQSHLQEDEENSCSDVERRSGSDVHVAEISRFLAYLLPAGLKQCEGRGRVLISPKNPSEEFVLSAETLLLMVEVSSLMLRERGHFSQMDGSRTAGQLRSVFGVEAGRCLAALSQTLHSFQSVGELARVFKIIADVAKLSARSVSVTSVDGRFSRREKIASALERCHVALLKRTAQVLRLRNDQPRFSVLHEGESESFEQLAADLGGLLDFSSRHESERSCRASSTSLGTVPAIVSDDHHSSRSRPRLLDTEFGALLRLLPVVLDPSLRLNHGGLQISILDVLTTELRARTAEVHCMDFCIIESCAQALSSARSSFLLVNGHAPITPGHAAFVSAFGIFVQEILSKQESFQKLSRSSQEALRCFSVSREDLHGDHKIVLSDLRERQRIFTVGADRLTLPVWQAVELANSIVEAEDRGRNGAVQHDKPPEAAAEQPVLAFLEDLLDNVAQRCTVANGNSAGVGGGNSDGGPRTREIFQAASGDAARRFAAVIEGVMERRTDAEESASLRLRRLAQSARAFAAFHGVEAR